MKKVICVVQTNSHLGVEAPLTVLHIDTAVNYDTLHDLNKTEDLYIFFDDCTYRLKSWERGEYFQWKLNDKVELMFRSTGTRADGSTYKHGWAYWTTKPDSMAKIVIDALAERYLLLV